MRIKQNLPLLIVIGSLAIIFFVSIFYNLQSKKNDVKNQPLAEQSNQEAFYLVDGWKETNSSDENVILRLIPDSKVFVTSNLKIQTYVRVVKDDNTNSTLSNGLVIGNMLPGEDQRWLRLMYYQPDQNWALEYMRGTKPTYYTVLHKEMEEDVATALFIITIMKDGKTIIVDSPDASLQTITLDESIYDVVNNLFFAGLIAPRSTLQVSILNAFQW